MRLPKFLATLALPAFCLSFSASAFAQPAVVGPYQAASASGRGVPQVASPQVNADGTVTYRFYAPHAPSVTFTGDFYTRAVAMTKGDDGVWTFTSDPMAPGIYGYYFTVDGIRMTDPSNLYSLPGAHFLKSYVEVPGDGKQYWSTRAVPHGELHELWYDNPKLGLRHLVVYTPPGYDAAASKTYPAVYLYSGSGDNETYWTKIGRANFIMDNLIADGKAAPAILVMPYGSTVMPSPADGQEDSKDGIYAVNAIGDDLVGSVIPAIEKNFKVGKTPQDRAIFGFSMGGYLAPTIGLNHPDIFGWVAGSSADFRNPGGALANFPGLVQGLAAAKTNLRWFGMMVGTDTASGESGHTNASKAAVDYVASLGLQAEWDQPAGGSHTWYSWRSYFYALMADKFFKDKPYESRKIGAAPEAPSAPAAALAALNAAAAK
jgi:enterochelin esterase family protein